MESENRDNRLKGKKILMFSPHAVTQHYCDSIIVELERRGAIVKDYDERPSQSVIGKIIVRYLNRTLSNYFENYIHKIIRENEGIEFDYIFAIRAEAFTPRIIKILRDAYPKAEFILYMWDLLSVRKTDDIIPLFDRALTFDISDSKTSTKLLFRPTFCASQYEIITEPFNKDDFDILFVGTLHTNRYKILQELKDYFQRLHLTSCFRFYVPAGIVYMLNRLRNKKYASFKEVRFRPYSFKETIELMKRSKALLDLRYGDKENLSMRAFEALISGRKYITNNPSITKYDFYNPHNILLISEKSPSIPLSFFETPYITIPKEILDKYRVSQWIEDVFFNAQRNFFKQ